MNHSFSGIQKLTQLMERLRDPEKGCPWDLQQTHESLLPYFKEELAEFSEAYFESGATSTEFISELGDLLFQIVFHAQILKENKTTDFNQIAEVIYEKMLKRHAHVFEGNPQNLSLEAIQEKWDAVKATEAKNSKENVSLKKSLSQEMKKIPPELNQLDQAEKIGVASKKFNFDWKDPSEVWKKVKEEVTELEEASSLQDKEEELGDLLFSLCQYSRQHNLNASQSLEKAIFKFKKRILGMEKQIELKGKEWPALSAEELEEFWEISKSKS